MPRHLSIHIGSRWYRSPEIILVEKHYDQACDLWSFGCVIYELLNFYSCNPDNEASLKKYNRERFLFPGNSCFPLSPCEANIKSKMKETNIIDKIDQLKIILKQLGPL